MRGVQSRASVQAAARPVSENAQDRVHIVAVYGAFAVIAAIVFGTLSFHPF